MTTNKADKQIFTRENKQNRKIQKEYIQNTIIQLFKSKKKLIKEFFL